MLLGLHLSIGKGFRESLRLATELKCQTIQTFVKNPRAWGASAFDEEGAKYVKENKDKLGIAPWVVHVSYLVNPASPDQEIYEKSLASLYLEIERAIALGAELFVLHAGNRKESSQRKALAKLQGSLELLLTRFAPAIKIVVENSSGKGTELAADILELAEIVRPFSVDSLGVCFDSCHGFSAGYDLRNEEAWKKTKALLFDNFEPQRLSLLHVNDSQGGLNSRIDRHAHLGEGEIGKEGFAAIFKDKDMRALPCILETPGPANPDGLRNLNFLRKMDEKNG